MERELINWLERWLPSVPEGFLGIGDDAAAVPCAPVANGRQLVVTTDALIENIHFDDKLLAPQIGRKALAVNLSDLAAMAAEPIAAVVNLCIPYCVNLEFIQEIYRGLVQLANEYGVAVVGGDTNLGSSELTIALTVLGRPFPHGLWRLNSARPGDQILVSGSFGASRQQKHFAFQPRIHLARQLAQQDRVHAATDVSDGLSLDLIQMAQSSGVGCRVTAETIPFSNDLLELGDANRWEFEALLECALSDGEDFELILAVGPAAASDLLATPQFERELTRIGEFTEAREFQIEVAGHTGLLKPQGFIHGETR